jgi:hypothetical protein
MARWYWQLIASDWREITIGISYRQCQNTRNSFQKRSPAGARLLLNRPGGACLAKTPLPRACGARKFPPVEGRNFGTPPPRRVSPDAGRSAWAATRKQSHDSNPRRPRNRDCHPPEASSLTGYPGPEVWYLLTRSENPATAGRLFSKSHPRHQKPKDRPNREG